MDFSRQKYWSALPFPPPGIELASPAMQANSFPAEPSGKPWSLWSWGQILSLPPFSSNPAETPPPGQTPDPRGRHDPRPCDCGITADLCTHCAFHLEPPFLCQEFLVPPSGTSSPPPTFSLPFPQVQQTAQGSRGHLWVTHLLWPTPSLCGPLKTSRGTTPMVPRGPVLLLCLVGAPR